MEELVRSTNLEIENFQDKKDHCSFNIGPLSFWLYNNFDLLVDIGYKVVTYHLKNEVYFLSLFEQIVGHLL